MRKYSRSIHATKSHYVDMKKISSCPSKSYDLAGNRNTEKSNLNATKRIRSSSTLKLTKFYKLRDCFRLGPNSRNYAECAKILFSSRIHIKIREIREKKCSLKKIKV